MSRSPNTLNLNAYSQGEGINQQLQQQIDQTDAQLQSQTIEQQFDNFVRDIQNYNQIINQLSKNMDDANNQQYFITDFYPQFILSGCTYEDDEEKRIVATTDPQLARIMQNLQRNNHTLKQQLKGWLFEFAKKTRLSQILISENEVLRSRLCSKNKQIVKLINTINNTDNTDIVQLSDNLNQLKQQNGVLMDHLNKVRESLRDNKKQQVKLMQAYDQIQRDKINIESKIVQAEDQQEHNAKKVILLETSIDQLSKRQRKLLSQKQRLTKILEDYRKDESNIQKELDNCNIDRKDIENQLKSKFKGHQSQKQRLMDQIQDISEQVQQVKQQTRNYQAEISRNQRKIEQFTAMTENLDKKLKQSQQQADNSQKQLNDVIKAQTQYLSELDMTNFDIELAKQQLKELQLAEQLQEQDFKAEMKRLQQDKKKEIEKWTQQYHRVQRQSSTKVLQQKSELAFKKKQVEDWQRKVADKNNQLIDLKAQLKQIKQNQSKVIQLRKKLRQSKIQ